ncbi:hypothetical protein [Kingella denitrificans]|nr:hypothetical protein [Kingella denitrificans]
MLHGFALSLTLSHGRGDWVVILPPLVYAEAVLAERAGCFQVAFGRLARV